MLDEYKSGMDGWWLPKIKRTHPILQDQEAFFE